MNIIRLLVLISLTYSCSSEDKGIPSPQEKQENISQALTEPGPFTMKVHVYYETGAEPYEGSIHLGLNKTWDITKASLVSLFQNIAGRGFSIPYELSEMKQLTNQVKASWTTSELVSLAEEFVTPIMKNQVINTYVVFLNGKYNNNSNILGIHLTGKNYVFVFKDVVQSVGGTPDEQRYVEQATVVHELGHLVGLVNNGITPATNHEDQAHQKHTMNKKCVMYWAVENPSQILTLLSTVIGNKDLNLFGPEVVQDVSNH